MATRRGRSGWRVGVVAALALPAAVAALALGPRLDRPATVDQPADRGASSQVTDTVPPPISCERVIVIGDSLTDNAGPWTRSALAERGYSWFVDAQPSRRIPAGVRAPYSGVRAAEAARASFGEADCWLVALGSNDLVFGGDDPVVAESYVREMLAAVTPGALVHWVNVNYHRDPQTRFDFPRATGVFNAVLDDVAADSERLVVIDWYSYSEAHPGWFFDPVHVDRTGSIARAEFTVAALPPPRR